MRSNDDDDHLNGNSNNGSGDSNEPPDDGEQQPEEEPEDDGNDAEELIAPSDLGLPSDPDMGVIPSDADLRAAAVRALDDISALFILNKESEQVIANQLNNIASVLLAASQIKGPHQAKAVRLGLRLNHRFWQTHHKENAWLQLIIPLINTALELGDKQLQAEAYHAWGIYLYTSGKNVNQPKSAKAFQIALDYAAESGRDDLKLLARIEHFNQQIGSLSEQDTLANAQELLAGARRLQGIYFEGRVYLSLARYYHHVLDYRQVFHYAQQAMVIFWILEDYGLFCQSLGLLTGGLLGEMPHLKYRQQLLAMMEQMASHIAYPYVSALLYHLWAIEYYKMKLYEEARSAMLKSLWIVRNLDNLSDLSVARHMMGLIELRLHRWKLTELFLEAALRGYGEASVDQIQSTSAEHALAFIPFEQGNYALAYVELSKVLETTQSLPPSPARDNLIEIISNDVSRAKQAMEST